jgi:hypothetical protein
MVEPFIQLDSHQWILALQDIRYDPLYCPCHTHLVSRKKIPLESVMRHLDQTMAVLVSSNEKQELTTAISLASDEI